MIKVFFQGSFDLLHWGQVRAIERAREQGDYLIIGLNTDRLYKEYKGKEAAIPYMYRKKMLEALVNVDEVVPALMRHPLELLRKYDIDVYIICQEWKGTKMKEMNYMKSIGGKTVVLPYLKTISSTEIRAKIVKNYLEHSEKLCAKCHRKL